MRRLSTFSLAPRFSEGSGTKQSSVSRFNGFETIEMVLGLGAIFFTSLKRGANEKVVPNLR